MGLAWRCASARDGSLGAGLRVVALARIRSAVLMACDTCAASVATSRLRKFIHNGVYNG